MKQIPDLPEIEWHDEVTSTNEMAMEAARNSAPHGAAIAAKVQNIGRGRGTRTWASPEGGLYMSMVVRPNLKADQWGLLPLATGLGAVMASERMVHEAGLVVTVDLKWPNDLIMHEKKLGGVLCQGTPGEYGVLGVGLNLNTKNEQLPKDVQELATSLPIETGHAYPLERAAFVMRLAVLEALKLFEKEPEKALKEYSERCLTLGQNVKWPDGEGQALAITETGSLMVETAAGQQEITEEVHLD